MTQARSYAGKSVEVRRRERHARFLEAGLTLFGTAGYAATSVPAVCKEAGLSSRQFYELFTDREHLLRDLYDRLQEESMAAVSAGLHDALDSNADLDGVLDAGVRAFVDYYATSPHRTRVNFVESVGVSPAFEEHRHAGRAQWSTLLGSVTDLAAGRGLDVAPASPLTWAGYIGAVNALIVERSVDPAVTTDDVMAAMRRLLRPGVIG